MDSNFYFNSDSEFNFGHESNASEDLAISILIPSHSNFHSHSDFDREPNTPLSRVDGLIKERKEKKKKKK